MNMFNFLTKYLPCDKDFLFSREIFDEQITISVIYWSSGKYFCFIKSNVVQY